MELGGVKVTITGFILPRVSAYLLIAVFSGVLQAEEKPLMSTQQIQCANLTYSSVMLAYIENSTAYLVSNGGNFPLDFDSLLRCGWTIKSIHPTASHVASAYVVLDNQRKWQVPTVP